MSDEEYIQQLEAEYKKANLEKRDVNLAYGTTLFSAEERENNIRWMLDIKEDLERMEHLLRNHVPKVDGKGNIIYMKPEIHNQILNEKGVNQILNFLGFYLNKNLFLSNFDEDEVKIRCMQFGESFVDFLHNNYQEFGLNTPEKMKHYPMICLNVINTVEAAYHRCLNGMTAHSINKMTFVSQSEPFGNNQNAQNIMPQRRKSFSLLKPSSWV